MSKEKTKGRLILKEILFKDVHKRKVGKNNKTSGKVTLPTELIGKEVYIVVSNE